MLLKKCSRGRAGNSDQMVRIEYPKYDRNNGFKPWKVFFLRNLAHGSMSLRVSDDNSMLLPE